MSRKLKEIEADLRKIMGEMMLHREALQALDNKRQELLKEYKGFSSSIASTSVVGAPGVIQGPPPSQEKKND